MDKYPQFISSITALVFTVIFVLFFGCNKNDKVENGGPAKRNQVPPAAEKTESSKSPVGKVSQSSGLPISPLQEKDESVGETDKIASNKNVKPNPRAVAEQLNYQGRQFIEPPMDIDQELVAAAGIQRIQGKHVDIYTDVRNRQDILEFAEVFDQAVPQWCDYFDIDQDKVKGWKLSGFIVLDKDRFRRAGLFPEHLPKFLVGWQSGHEFWVYPQPGEYYTRHLLIHEGTHGFMRHFLKGTGAPWYTEGMAELLALHTWQDGKLQIRCRVDNSNDCAYWGRVGVIREDRQQESTMTFEDVFQIESRAFLEVRAYAWAWAACEFFDSHPLTHDHFKKLQSTASDHTITFSRNFKRSIFDKYPQLQEQWEMFIAEIEYGYDVQAASIKQIAQQNSLPLDVNVDVSRGWQSTGIELQEGQSIQVNSNGRFQVANHDGEQWPCEADGITIEYYLGRPLGKLIAVIKPAGINPGEKSAAQSPLADPTQWIELGTNSEVTAPVSGTLYIRINESPARFYDNEGSLKVSLKLKEQ